MFGRKPARPAAPVAASVGLGSEGEGEEGGPGDVHADSCTLPGTWDELVGTQLYRHVGLEQEPWGIRAELDEGRTRSCRHMMSGAVGRHMCRERSDELCRAEGRSSDVGRGQRSGTRTIGRLGSPSDRQD